MSVVVLCAFSALAQERMPWQLSIAERLALRLEAARIPSQPRVQSTQRDEKPAPRFVIDGRETPELFLRTELMAILLSEFGDQTDRSRILDSYRSMQLELEWSPEAFWRDFETASRSYYDSVEGDAGTVSICRGRAAALSEMVKRYPRFEEFLYRVVAPRQTLMSDRIVPVDHLRWLEEGCL